jgi:hypothetical protein
MASLDDMILKAQKVVVFVMFVASLNPCSSQKIKSE